MLNQGRFWTRCVRRLLQDIINPTVILCTPKLASFSFPSPPSLLSSLPLPASPSLSVPPCFLSHIHSCLHCFPDRANGDRSSLLPPPLQVVMQVSPLTSPPPTPASEPIPEVAGYRPHQTRTVRDLWDYGTDVRSVLRPGSEVGMETREASGAQGSRGGVGGGSGH